MSPETQNSGDPSPIGVFDSGVGGLTVVRALRRRLPSERIVYLGDTARVPYGTKSPETVIRYARACTRVLLERGVKLLVIACNTASAHALPTLQNELGTPVIGVIEPGSQAAAAASATGRIGIIGTRGTIESGAYQRALARLAPRARVYARPCPMFVPLAEEGWVEGPIPRQIAIEYLTEFRDVHRVDSLLLACTHYPLLTATISAVMGPAVPLIDSAEATAQAAEDSLARLRARAPADERGSLSCLVSDSPDRFAETGRAFLGEALGDVSWVDV
jgi:glutamate racemase